MSETFLLPVDGAELAVESFGDAGDPLLLLVAGAAASMDLWPPTLCSALAAGGRRVIRYDHRDTGASTTGTPGLTSYGATALQDDVAALVEVLGGGRPADLVGLSMGGGIAQALAMTRPELVASLTVVASSPVGGVGDDLPGPLPAVADSFADPVPDPDWTDRDAYLDWFTAGERLLAGDGYLDEAEVRAGALATWERSHDVAAAGNHWLVIGDEPDGPDGPGGPDHPGALDVHDLRLPTLVVHGRLDPLFPPAHGEALATAVPGARLLIVDGMGHQVPPASARPTVVAAVLDLTGR